MGNLNEIWIAVLSTIQNASLVDLFDILIMAVLIYGVISFVRKTNTTQMAKGILVVVLLYFVAEIFEMRAFRYFVTEFTLYGVIAMVVVFQPELRRALETMGRNSFSRFANFGFQSSAKSIKDVWQQAIMVIADTAERLSASKTGALIVIERSSNLDEVLKTGTKVDASTSSELLASLFYVGAALHDGAVVIRNGRIAAAGCILPLSSDLEIGKDMGTRHRAALGMSDSSDALIVVVSEETGIISLAKNGIIVRRLERQSLINMLHADLIPKADETKKKPFWAAWRKKDGQTTDE